MYTVQYFFEQDFTSLFVVLEKAPRVVVEGVVAGRRYRLLLSML